MRARTIACLGCATVLLTAAYADAPGQHWTNFARIGAYGLRGGDAEAIVRDAQASHVYGIEVDNDIPGRYESFLDPSAKLKAIRAVADAAHQAKNHAVVYIAGTECITANADKSAHSVMKDHPDWLQRKITSEPAVFTSGAAFWIRPGDEDVWISPYAKDWRKIYMQHVREIAATGIDGIYVDIPYWMTHFDGWEDTWASFDDATVAAFRQKTGLDARKEVKLGDFQDANFRKWIDFRIETMTDFVKEIRENARSVNPEIVVIPEIYPGIEQESTRVGADVYEMYGVVDAVAHEYEFGDGDHMASSRSQLDWFLYQAGMLTFRSFAAGKATWILNYSWDGDKNVDAREAMKNLAMSQVIAGANFWDAPGHSMAGSNDKATRAEIFKWIEKNENILYAPRVPLHPIGVYFSPKSRDYDPNGFLPSYRGTLVMLLQAHREFQVITPRTLEKFRGQTLILPNVTTLSDSEKQALRQFASRGSRLVITGSDVTGITLPKQTVRFENCPGKAYFEKLQSNFAAGSQEIPKDFLQALIQKSEVDLEAPPTVAANFGLVDGTPHVFIANFSGLVPGKVAIPTSVSGARVSVPAAAGNSLAYLPFLGQTQILHGTKHGDTIHGDTMQFDLPPIERGAVAWVVAN
jgi:endo-alpha-1,4-polygalactosaminidase (GH114 family)